MASNDLSLIILLLTWNKFRVFWVIFFSEHLIRHDSCYVWRLYVVMDIMIVAVFSGSGGNQLRGSKFSA